MFKLAIDLFCSCYLISMVVSWLAVHKKFNSDDTIPYGTILITLFPILLLFKSINFKFFKKSNKTFDRFAKIFFLIEL
jgi:hypothetical protein